MRYRIAGFYGLDSAAAESIIGQDMMEGVLMSYRRVLATTITVLLAMVASVALAQFSQKTIVAEGEGETKDEAVKRALRTAVEQGVGVLVDSETLVENKELLNDKIYTEVKGYVVSYKVLEETEEEGLFSTKVEAIVSLENLRKSIKGLKIILEEKENPRFAVSFSEYIDGADLPSPELRPLFEKKLKEDQFEVIDIAQLEKIKERDATLNYEDPIQAAALGRRMGAEVLIIGEASAELGNVSVAHGVKVYSYSVNVTVKAIKTDTADIIAVESVSETERGGGTKGETGVARDALRTAGNKIYRKLTNKVIETWRSEVYNVTKFQIILMNADEEDRGVFVRNLEEISGIEKVIERSIVEDTVILDALVLGSATATLPEKVLAMEDLPLELKDKSPNRMKVAIILDE
jgi:hypothetical protein